MTALTRCFLYARVSSRHQRESGLGIASQLHSMQKYADDNGYDVVDSFCDEAIGGAMPLHRRPALLACLHKLTPGDIVLFADRSRIGREPLVVLSIESEIYNAGGQIETIDGISCSDETPEQILIKRLIDSVNEFQRGVLRAKTSLALQELKRAGKSTGKAPYGYCVGSDGVFLTENESEQKVLKKVKTLRRKGKSWSKVADVLNTFSCNRLSNAWTRHATYSTFSKHTS